MSFQALLFCPDEKTARVVTQVLQELDFQVEPNAEPFAAVKKLTAQRFDAVVVDCQNEQNASLVFKSARNSNLNQSCLMVAIVEGQAGVASAFRIGANLVLTKPIAIEQARSTMRVARGLLRKSEVSGQKAAVPSAPTAPDPTPAAASAPVSIPSKPMGAPNVPSPASVPQVSMAPKARAARLVTPVSDSVLQKTPEQDPLPDDAEVGLLEALQHDSSTKQAVAEEIEPAASAVVPTRVFPVAPKPASKPFTTFEAQPAAPASVQPKPAPPVASAMAPSTVASAGGAAAAPARAREKSPAAPKERALEIFDPPASGKAPEDPISPEVKEQIAKLSAPAFNISEAGEEKRNKLPLIAAVVLIAVIGAGYFGWTMLGKKSAQPAPAPAVQPQSAVPNTPPAAPMTTQGGSSAPASQSFEQATWSSPTAEITLKTAPEKTSPAAKSKSEESDIAGQVQPAPIRVKSAGRVLAPSQPVTESVQAPDMVASVGNSDALSAIVRTPNSAIPKAAAQAVRVSQGVSEGLVLHRVQPVYPPQALRMRQEGNVQLQAVVAKDGSIKDVKLISGPPVLGRAAIDAVRQWKYKPYYLNGEPVEIQTQVAVNFKLPK